MGLAVIVVIVVLAGCRFGFEDRPPDGAVPSVFERVALPPGGRVTRLAAPAAPLSSLYGLLRETVLHSPDGGGTWSRCAPTNAGNRAIAVHPLAATVVFVGTDAGVLRSDDSCASWQTMGLELDTFSVAATATTVFAGAEDGVWRWTGGAWTQLARPFVAGSVRAVAAAPDGQLLFAATHGQGVAMSSDGGVSWQLRNTGITDLDFERLILDPDDSSRVFYLSTTTAYRTTDAVAGWSAVGQGGTSVAFDGVDAARVAMFNWSGIARSTSGGASFSGDSRSAEMNRAGVNDLLPDPVNGGRLFAATERGVFESVDHGATWLPRLVGLDTWRINSITTVDGRVYLTTESGVLVHDGTSWSVQSSGMQQVSLTRAIATRGSELLVAGRNLYTSADGTLFTFVFAPDGFDDSRSFTTVAIDGTRAWAGTATALAYSDDLMTWIEADIGGRDARDILVAGTGRILVGTSDGVRLSQDGGASFQDASAGLAGLAVHDLERLDSGAIAIATSDGVWITADPATGWARAGLDGSRVHELLVAGTALVAATAEGVKWTRDPASAWSTLPGLETLDPIALGVSPLGELLVGTAATGLYRTAVP